MSERSDKETPQPMTQGVYDAPPRPQITGIEAAAILLSLIWMGGAIVVLVIRPEGLQARFDAVTFVVTLMAVFLPVAMIWVAATAARASRLMREESQRLQTAIDAIRQSYLAQQQKRGAMAPDPVLMKKLEEIATAVKRTETALGERPAPPRDGLGAIPQTAAAGAAGTTENQGLLELGTPADNLAEPLGTQDFLRALNFPETAEDKAGFAALRRALQDRRASELIQASQDVLTLLSEEAIYVDDLRPDKARPEIWRLFAQGVRGRAVAGLGGIHDRAALALTSARMKRDPIFRDAAHHFLRKFDRIFAEFEPTATDGEISALSETRTARAFMLLGRVAGTFK
ncbi:MAG: hypothetical protein NXH82_00285 [Rhodobacteraceae bacterium]|nr:hypothetical protein [Paracoccaceae bacterium]